MSGDRKIGGNTKKPSSKAYKAEQRWQPNKRRRMTRHVKRHPNDAQAARLLARA